MASEAAALAEGGLSVRDRVERLRSEYFTVCQDFGEPPAPFVLRALDAGAIDERVELNLSATSPLAEGVKLEDRQVAVLAEALVVVADVLPLRALDLSFHAAGDKAARALGLYLKRSRSLQRLQLQGNSIGPLGGEALAEALLEHQSLASIDVSHNPLGDRGVAAIARALSGLHNASLRDFRADCTEAGMQALVDLATSLRTNATLRSVSVAHAKVASVEDESTIHFAEALGLNATLEELSLAKQGIHDVGCMWLGEYLQRNRTLRRLDLSGNNITSTGVEYLRAALAAPGCGLQWLDLSNNCIADEAAEELEAAIAANKSLRFLGLATTSLTDVALVRIAAALRVNQSLEGVTLAGNLFGVEARKAFQQLLADHAASALRAGRELDFFPLVM